MPHVKEYGDIGRYSARTQEAIIAHATQEATDAGTYIGDALLRRAVELSRLVREAEDRAAVAYAQEVRIARTIPEVHYRSDGSRCECNVLSLAPSGTD